ncbi:MAG: SGNH/GDSL hydrolase family protein, partial [Candidatus Berkiella sp.]
KFLNNKHTEFENKSIKKVVHQRYVSKIIDNNIGRFIKLREHKPSHEKFERPTRNYIKNIAPNVIERKYYRLATDKDGFIMPSGIHENPDLKIVFLGGSTTECLYMDEHERFPYVVGRLLEQDLGKTVNSYNGGVSANESQHSINILLNKVLAMKPNMVVLMHNINDLAILRSQGTYWYQDSLKSHIQSSKNVFTRYEFPSKDHQVDDNAISEAFRKNLQTFVAICKIQEIRPVLMTQGNRVRDDALYHRFNEIIREVGQKESVLVIDLAKLMPQDPEHFYDAYHYTAFGANKAAQQIAANLKSIL